LGPDEVLQGWKQAEVTKYITKTPFLYNTLFFVNEMPGGGISVDKVKDYARNECKVGDNIECEVYVNPYVTKKGAPMHTIVVSKDGAFINLGSGSPKEKGVRV